MALSRVLTADRVVIVVFFTLTDRASTIPSNIQQYVREIRNGL